jgi:hypothetical protein
LSAYNLTINSTAPSMAVADVIDRIARFEVGDLLDEPHEWDLIPVHFPDDPAWVTTTVASELLGINRSNVAVDRGRVDGHLAWLADGGYRRNQPGKNNSPALPQIVVSRKSIDAYVELKARPSLKECARRLKMTASAVEHNFVPTGKLQPKVVAGENRTLRVDHCELDALVNEIHGAVIETLTFYGPSTPKRLRTLFNKHHGGMFAEGRALQTWLDAWVSTLVAEGKLRRRLDGSLSIAPPSAGETTRSGGVTPSP